MHGLARLAAAYGVAESYEPAPGHRVQVPTETVVAVLAALGVDASGPDAVRDALERHEKSLAARLLPPTVVLVAADPAVGARLPADLVAGLPPGTDLRVTTEDGRSLPLGRTGDTPASTAPAVPLGVHALDAEAPDGRRARVHLLVSPQRVPEPAGRAHGLMVQLYSLLSEHSWGMGDLADLAQLAGWAGRSAGAGFVQLNPLHAAVPGLSGESTDPSPYRPATRRFADPVHLRVEAVPEYALLGGEDRYRADALLARAELLREAVLERGTPVDRDEVWRLKQEALELVARVPLGPGRHAAYCAFLAEHGRALEDHATWCALTELYGPDWTAWPGALRDPRSTGTARARAEHLTRIDFHSRLAWLVDEQLAGAQRAAREAGMGIGLIHDLALGVHPRGSESWAQQHVLAGGMSTGAPPDAFSAEGQDWGLPPWRPDALAEAGYAPYRDLLTGLLRHAGGLRIDHVMSHFRLWWIPEGRPPREGTYVSYDASAMLGTLALAAHRADAVVVGEDLGTVAPGVREELAGRSVLGTSVLWFERDWEKAGADGTAPILRPGEWRSGCLATVTTHDLPPTAARLTGEDVELRARLGLLGGHAGGDGAGGHAARDADARERRRTEALETARTDARREIDDWLELFRRMGLLRPGAGEEQQIVAAYRFLARTPARLLGIWLPDAVGDRRSQNVPGTWREYPNWRLPIADATGRPVTLERLTGSARAMALLEAVRAETARRPEDPPGATGSAPPAAEETSRTA
ncbi:4-alpha-glucanotransferase [Streptomyces sp. ST2-7A]|uniref:4-alpha-glucanotransferase n=1 Tax=Streptomyces sp. ST2-7A TaxID=2907214 RepID=UPI001F3A49C3|nr:4-alpha-glucanotransferase [Streptomyces sp. ST2-7A]MCE7079248.1 4-alpha-glucanotransferase [Streptomyces sp. ST2-7A]